MAASTTTQEIVWLQALNYDMQFKKNQEPITIFCDNQSKANTVSNDPQLSPSD